MADSTLAPSIKKEQIIFLCVFNLRFITQPSMIIISFKLIHSWCHFTPPFYFMKFLRYDSASFIQVTIFTHSVTTSTRPCNFHVTIMCGVSSILQRAIFIHTLSLPTIDYFPYFLSIPMFNLFFSIISSSTYIFLLLIIISLFSPIYIFYFPFSIIFMWQSCVVSVLFCSRLIFLSILCSMSTDGATVLSAILNCTNKSNRACNSLRNTMINIWIKRAVFT